MRCSKEPNSIYQSTKTYHKYITNLNFKRSSKPTISLISCIHCHTTIVYSLLSISLMETMDLFNLKQLISIIV